MKYLFLIISLFVTSSHLSAQESKMKDLAGKYRLEYNVIVDLDDVTAEKQEPDPNINVTLTIGKHGSVVYGAGKIHELELIRDLENGYAYYAEKNRVEEETYVTKYCLKVTKDHFILYHYPKNGKIGKAYYKREQKESSNQ